MNTHNTCTTIRLSQTQCCHVECIRFITGLASGNDGYITVDISVLVGETLREETIGGGFFGMGETVLEACYTKIKSVEVRGPNSNAWSGSAGA